MTDFWEPISADDYLAELKRITSAKGDRKRKAIALSHADLANRMAHAATKLEARDLKIRRATTVLASSELAPGDRVLLALEILTHATGVDNSPHLETVRQELETRKGGKPRIEVPNYRTLAQRIRRRQQQGHKNGYELGIEYRFTGENICQILENGQWEGKYDIPSLAKRILELANPSSED